jgi:glycosyltransferase involved in cell wall biosynthesis
MRILIALTYYRPHTSGLTIYAERIAKAFAKRGHQVTVLTSQFQKNLPSEEFAEGVKIIRAPVLTRISKGVIMPTFGLLANKLVAENDVIQLHLPQFDAAGIALRGRLLRKPTVVTYHCDLKMPPGLLAWIANMGVNIMNHLAARATHRIVTYTQDYAEHSTLLASYLKKVKVISPPVELPESTGNQVADFKRENNPDKRFPLIGMAARFASEKGVEVLLDALPAILKLHPETRVLFAGPYQGIVGEEAYSSRLSPRIKKYSDQGVWHFVGELNPLQMTAFYRSIDLLVLPSLNSTEAFGLVQIEAMLNGVPCVAANLPGVRQPVLRHKMGNIAEIGDADSLAEAILTTLRNSSSMKPDIAGLKEEYNPERIAEEYEHLFTDISKEINPL